VRIFPRSEAQRTIFVRQTTRHQVALAGVLRASAFALGHQALSSPPREPPRRTSNWAVPL